MNRPADTKLRGVPPEPTAPTASPMISSSKLFQSGNTLHIAYAGQIYQLRITRENKLILTK